MAHAGKDPRRSKVESTFQFVQSSGNDVPAVRWRWNEVRTASAMPILLDVSQWGQTLTETPRGRCDLIATLAALALLQNGLKERLNPHDLLIVADTSMEARLLASALREVELGSCSVYTPDRLPRKISGMQLVLVSATAENNLQLMDHCSAAGALPYCMVCNTTAKVGEFWQSSVHPDYRMLRFDADLMEVLAGRSAHWVSLIQSLPRDLGEWRQVSARISRSSAPLYVVPCSDTRILASTIDRCNSVSLATSLSIELPRTLSLFLHDCVGLDPYEVHMMCHMPSLTTDLADLADQTQIDLWSHATASGRNVVSTVSLRRDRGAVSQPDSPPHGPTEDRSRHYGDDQWFDTEAEKEAQDRRQGGKISYSDVGIRRQRPGEIDLTPDQQQRLRKMLGTPGKDQ